MFICDKTLAQDHFHSFHVSGGGFGWYGYIVDESLWLVPEKYLSSIFAPLGVVILLIIVTYNHNLHAFAYTIH